MRSTKLVLALAAAALTAVVPLAVPAQAAGGDPDPTFGPGGVVTTSFPQGPASARLVLVRGNGRIVAVGDVLAGGKQNLALAQYLGNGSLDTSFGSSGEVVTSLGFSSVPVDALLDDSGRLVVAVADSSSGAISLVRFLTTGAIDTTFGTSGVVHTPVGGAAGGGVALQGGGKIDVAGAVQGDTNLDFAVARYDDHGAADQGFGKAGLATTDLGGNDAALAVSVGPDGKIVLAGSSNTRFAMARLNQGDGTLDKTFANGGQLILALGAQSTAEAVHVQYDGIWAAGWSQASTAAGAQPVMTAVRLNLADGSLHKGFGTRGVATTRVAGAAHRLAVMADHRVVLAGSSLIRLNRNGSADHTFGPVSGAGFAAGFTGLDAQPDDKILTAETGSGSSGGTAWEVSRFLGANYRPDALVRTWDTRYVGGHVFGSSGANEQRFAWVQPGTAKTYVIRVDNLGNGVDSFQVTGGRSAGPFHVTYLANDHGGSDITASVEHGTYVFRNLAPGATRYLRARVFVESGAARGVKSSWRVLVRSTHQPSRVDAVRFQAGVSKTAR